MGLGLEQELYIPSAFRIGDRESPKVSVGYIVLDSKPERIDIKVLRTGNIVDGY